MKTSFQSKSGKAITLRSYEAHDENEVRSFITQVAKDSFHTLKYEGMPMDMIIKRLLEPSDSFGAFFEDKLIGNLRFFQPSPNHPWIKHVGNFAIAVLKDHWGDGIAQAMLNHMYETAKGMGISRIEAEVRCSNTQAIALYLKNGFKIEGMRENAAIINGVVENDYYIAKLL